MDLTINGSPRGKAGSRSSCNCDVLVQRDSPKSRRGRAGYGGGGGGGTYPPPPPPQPSFSGNARCHTNVGAYNDGSYAKQHHSGDQCWCERHWDKSSARNGKYPAPSSGHWLGETSSSMRTRRSLSGSDFDCDVSDAAGSRDKDDQGQESQSTGRVAQIAEGLLWVQKHPVLAAVIWMFGKVLTPGEENPEEALSEGDSDRRSSLDMQSDGQMSGQERGRDVIRTGWRDDFDSSLEEQRRNMPSGLWRRQSKGRLSWSDDHGGCLAEYYEDERAAPPSDASSAPSQTPQDKQRDHHSLSVPMGTSSGVSMKSGAVQPTTSTSGCGVRNNRQHMWSPPERCGGQAEEFARSHAADDTSRTNGACSRMCSEKYLEPQQRPESNGGRHAGKSTSDNGHDEAEGKTMTSIDVQQREGHPDVLLPHRDTFYEDMTEALKDHKPSQLSTSSSCASILESASLASYRENVVGDTLYGVGKNEGEDEEDFLPRTRSVSDSALRGGSVDGAAGEGNGTWSPQWGWYVSMTPPQELYPTPQATSNQLQTAPKTAIPGESATGRPPRP